MNQVKMDKIPDPPIVDMDIHIIHIIYSFLLCKRNKYSQITSIFLLFLLFVCVWYEETYFLVFLKKKILENKWS